MNTLLIVDDDPYLLKSLCIVFDGIYTVETVITADAAEASISQRAPDVVLLDVLLPDRDGLDLLKAIRKRLPLLPVVMISGASVIRSVLHAFELGAADFVRKPFNIEELRLRVARALQVAKIQAELARLKAKRQDHVDSPAAGTNGDGQPDLKTAVEQFERRLIEQALAEHDNVQTRAANALGTTRRILQYRIQKLGIAVNSH